MASIVKRGKAWRAQVKSNKARLTKTFKTKACALIWANNTEQELKPQESHNEIMRKKIDRWMNPPPPKTLYNLPDPNEDPEKYGLLSKEAILSTSKDSAPIAGVYFLIRESNIVYIGQSIDIMGRLTQHRTSDKIYDRLSYIECADEDRTTLESKYIAMFRPIYNLRDDGTPIFSVERNDIAQNLTNCASL